MTILSERHNPEGEELRQALRDSNELLRKEEGSPNGEDRAKALSSPATIERIKAMANEERLRLQREAGPLLYEALRDTLKMLEAAQRELGMYTKHNPRIVKAHAALAKAEGRLP